MPVRAIGSAKVRKVHAPTRAHARVTRETQQSQRPCARARTQEARCLELIGSQGRAAFSRRSLGHRAAAVGKSFSIAVKLACNKSAAQNDRMNFDDQVRRYFGTSDLAAVHPEALRAGIERMKVDLGLTMDRGERFALWALLFTLGSAPDLDVVFANEAEREAARNFMDLIEGAGG